MKKKLLAVIDMQNDFIDGALGTKEALSIVPRVKERILRAQAEGETIVFTRDTHGSDYLSSLEGKSLPVPHCIKGTHGWEISADLPAAEKIIDKPTFGSVSLAEHVRKAGYEKVEIVGLCTDICVISNALLLKAFCPETEISVRADCCAGVTPESHQTALSAMCACQIKIV